MRILIFALAFFTAGIILVLRLTPQDIAAAFKGTGRSPDMKRLVKAARGRRKKRGAAKLAADTRATLQAMGREGTFRGLCIVSAALTAGGFLLAVFFNNFFLAPVLALCAALAPFHYVRFLGGRFNREVTAELETALSIITTGYMRAGNTFINSVEENLPYINQPVRQVFAEFLGKTRMLSSNTAEALGEMKEGIGNVVFHEWVDAVEAALGNQNLKPTLPPIVAKLSDIRVVSAELELMVYPAMQELLTMLLLLFGTVPVLWLINKDWYNILVHTQLGKGLTAVMVGAAFIAVTGAVKHMKPLDYR